MISDLRHLETFVAVCDARGFSRAAGRLGITQPAVSYRIRELEEQLGVELFEQPRRRIILTAAGRALYDTCARTLSELDATTAGLAGRGWDESEPVRIACAGAFGRFVVFPILCRPDFLDVPVHLLFRSPEEIFELVEGGACELGIVYFIRVTSALDLEEVCAEEFVMVSPPAAGWTDLSPDGLAEAPFVTYEECDYVFGKWFADVLGAQPPSLRSACHFERLEEVLGMVALGRGRSIVPEHAARRWLDEGRVARVDRPGRRCLNPEYAVTRPGRTMRPEVARLLEALREPS